MEETNHPSSLRTEAMMASCQGINHEQNQDMGCFAEDVYVICDGHGSNGKQISEFVGCLALQLLRGLSVQSNIQAKELIAVGKEIQLELENSGLDITFSGCTFLGVLIRQDKAYCISVGDSKAIVCSTLTERQLSVCHKPEIQSERKRIQEAGGVIRKLEVRKDQFSGPLRVWAPGKYSWGPGLAVSRAFGDKAAQSFGVFSTPDITCIELQAHHDFIVMGSDGLFDALTYAQISDIVYAHQQQLKMQIADKLVQEAKKKEPHDYDDTTVIVILLQKDQKSRSNC